MRLGAKRLLTRGFAGHVSRIHLWITLYPESHLFLAAAAAVIIVIIVLAALAFLSSLTVLYTLCPALWAPRPKVFQITYYATWMRFTYLENIHKEPAYKASERRRKTFSDAKVKVENGWGRRGGGWLAQLKFNGEKKLFYIRREFYQCVCVCVLRLSLTIFIRYFTPAENLTCAV